MRVKVILRICLLFSLALCMALVPLTNNSSYAADKVIKWKVQSHWPVASPSYKGSLLVLVERIKKRTNGRLILEPYPAGALVPQSLSVEPVRAVPRRPAAHQTRVFE